LTNFPMWLKGNRIDPTFNYTIQKMNGITGLKDEVLFIKNGKEKAITGFDTPLNEGNTKFEWRGNGWMKILKSRWEILFLTEKWGIIFFEKTLFTPKGYDVIARNENLSEELLTEINAKLKALKIDSLENIR
ncbi:MAG: hypothetical protein ACPGXZ_12675, partial [Saprospiraceae bacterium]